MTRWPLLGALLVCCATSPAFANSRFSLRGAGEAAFPQRADTRALGSAEAASNRPSIAGNPASLSFASQGIFQGSFETEWIEVKEPLDAGDLLRKDYVYLVPNLTLMFPLPSDLAFGVGVLVDRRIGGRIEVDAATPSGQDYLQVFEASGNLIRFPLLVAYRRGDFAIGSGVDVLLRNQRDRWRNDFPQGVEFQDSNDIDKTSGWGAAWRTGALVPVGSRVTLGAWFSLPSTLEGSRRLENDNVGDDPDDLKVDRTTEIAPQWSVGAEARVTERLRFIGDWVHEAWSDVEPLSPVDELIDVDRFAAGLEWTTDSDNAANWPVRVGFRTEKLHALDGKGEEVRERVFTAGSGFGFAAGRGSLDWYLDFGLRGDEAENEYAEKFVRFGVTLTGFERWSRRKPVEQDEDW